LKAAAMSAAPPATSQGARVDRRAGREPAPRVLHHAGRDLHLLVGIGLNRKKR
jgi:hypothetical protein